MEKPSEKYWIVLVSKVPQGPYSEAKLKELLNTQKIRRNEVGMLVSKDGSTPLSGWKILWQFKEFDRRLKKQVKLPPGKERRKELTSPEIEVIKKEKIPAYLLDINPEDLLVAGERPSNFGDRDGAEYGELDLENTSRPSKSSGYSYGNVFAVLGVLFFAYLVYAFVGTSPESRPNKVVRTVPVREPAQRSAPKVRRGMPLSKVKPRARQLPVAPPPIERTPEPDFGEISPADFEEFKEDEVEANEMNRDNIERRKRRKREPVQLKAQDEYGEDDYGDEPEEDYYYEDEEEEVLEEEYY